MDGVNSPADEGGHSVNMRRNLIITFRSTHSKANLFFADNREDHPTPVSELLANLRSHMANYMTNTQVWTRTPAPSDGAIRQLETVIGIRTCFHRPTKGSFEQLKNVALAFKVPFLLQLVGKMDDEQPVVFFPDVCRPELRHSRLPYRY